MDDPEDEEFSEETEEGERLDVEEEEDRAELKIDRATANKEFESWAETMRLDIDESIMNVEEKGDFRTMKNKFVYNLMRGYTQMEENGDLTLNLISHIKDKKNKQIKHITFRKNFQGAAILAMDRHKAGEDVHKTISFVGMWVKVDVKQLSRLGGVEFWFCMKMASLFFGA